MKSRYLALFVMILYVLSIPSVNSIEEPILNVEHMPYEGDTNTPIIFFITTTPLKGTKPWYLYVFWDEIPIKDGAADVKIAAGSYEHRWRFSFLPPKARATKGGHIIQIWVYTDDGTILKKTEFYNIKGIIPQLTWWESLPQEFIDKITGPRGPAGPIGSTGTTGPTGPQGVTGETGSKGAIGPAGPQGEVGEQGPTGSRGEPGEAGTDGRDAQIGLLYIALGLSAISIICVILLFGRVR